MEISNDALKQISNLAKPQQKAEREVAEEEEALETKKAYLRHVQEDLLPNAMAEAGMKSFTLDTGEKITVKDDIAASIPKENQLAAFSWLRSHGYGDIIKHTVAVDFGKEEDEHARKLLSFCQENAFPATDKESVHAMTLKAFLKERMAAGVDIPLELFGAYPYSKAVIK